MQTLANMHGTAIEQFHQAADLMGLEPFMLKSLRTPQNEITVRFPVSFSEGDLEVFTGFRVQHNNLLGPFIGGLRFHPTIELADMRVLAAWTTWKAAIADIPFGGSMGGVRFDPSQYSRARLEKIVRRFAFAMAANIGPEYDIIHPDVNTDAQTMAWILDTYLSTLHPDERNAATHVVTGKPVYLGGSPGQEMATGYGLAILVREWLEQNGFDISKTTFAVQGFGKVGSWVARSLKSLGMRMLAVEDTSGPIFCSNGLDPNELLGFTKEHGGISEFPNAERLSHEEFFGVGVDVFIPAALENQINGSTAGLLNTRLVAEAANGPTDSPGYLTLLDKGIDVLPDILCNSGGLIVAYFEWLQNKRSESWDIDEVTTKLEKRLVMAYRKVGEAKREYATDWRTAAYIVALSTLDRVYKKRGIFP